jgi:hypothetical protein
MLGLLDKLFGPRPACKCGKRMVPLKRGIPIFVCPCGSMKIGERTVTLDGPANLLRWSGSGSPTVQGEVGMNIANGRLRQFVGGTVQEVANLSDITGGSSLLFDQAEDNSSGLFYSSSLEPNYTPIPSPTLSFNQVVPGVCVAFMQATDHYDIFSRTGNAFAVRIDGGTWIPLTWASSNGFGLVLSFQHCGFHRFSGIAAGGHTLEFGLAMAGTTQPVGVERSSFAPLRVMAIHT